MSPEELRSLAEEAAAGFGLNLAGDGAAGFGLNLVGDGAAGFGLNLADAGLACSDSWPAGGPVRIPAPGKPGSADTGATAKVVALMRCADGTRYVLKCYPADGTQAIIIRERQCAFAECLSRNKIPTPAHLRAAGAYVLPLHGAGGQWHVCAEEFIPGAGIRLTSSAVCAWGRLMAELHLVSEREGARIGMPSRWYNASRKNEIIRFDRFSQCRTYLCAQKEAGADPVSGECIRLYEQLYGCGSRLMEEANVLLRVLPACAVQGDLTCGNLFWTQDALGVLDFDEAGDCVPVSDLALQSVYLADLLTADGAEAEMEMLPLSGFGQTWKERTGQILEAYCACRPLTEPERRLYGILNTLARTFYFKRMDALKRALSRNEPDWHMTRGLLYAMLSEIEGKVR